jgi:hypothetical protein
VQAHPVLFPCNYLLFLQVNKPLRGRQFESADAISKVILALLPRLSTDDYSSAIHLPQPMAEGTDLVHYVE